MIRVAGRMYRVGVGVLLLTTSFLGQSSAAAEVVGTVSFTPVAGLDVHPMSAFTSAPCPKGTHLAGKIFGKGFPSEGVNLISNSPISIYPKGSNGGLEVPFLNTMRTYADLQGAKTELGGRYDVVVTCKEKAGRQSLADFKGSLTFTSPTKYTSGDGKTPAAVRVLSAEGDPTEFAYGPPPSESGSPQVAAPTAATAGESGTSNGSSTSTPWLVLVGGLAVASLAFVLGRRRRIPRHSSVEVSP